MTDQEIEIRRRLKEDFIHYASKCLMIRSKEGEIKPFVLNKAQAHIHREVENQKGRTGKVRALILKGRQQGCSTYVGGRFYHKTTHNFGTQTFILTHALDATNNLFKMAQRYYQNTPEYFRPSVATNNSKELIFGELDSGYKIGTAENKSVGRSSTIQFFHGCLGEDTMIFDPVSGGLRHIKSFNVGDPIYTHTGSIAPISFISQQEKACLQVKLRTLSHFPLIATPQHRFWTKQGWQELKDLKEGDCIGYPIQKIHDVITSLPLPEPTKRLHGGGRQFVCPSRIEINYEFGRLLGLYLAEGHVKLQYKFPNLPSHVVFAVHRKETQRTLDWLMPFNNYFSSINVKHRQNSLTTTICAYGSQFANLVNYLCGRVEEKHFPKGWATFGYEFCRGLLHGYASGDGNSSEKERRIRISSIRSSLTMGCRDIAASLGYGWGSIERKEAGKRNGRNEKEQFAFSLCGVGAERLAEEIGKPTVKSKREKTTSLKNNAANPIEISNGYSWMRITNIENYGMAEVYDFEVDHPDHSYCTIHGATHNSEVAFWANAAEHAKGILQAVPDAPGTEIILESTANGVGNYFHQMWQKAEAGISDFVAIFVPWFWQEEYTKALPEDFTLTAEEEEIKGQYNLTDGQIYWRRYKIIDLSVNGIDGEKAFKQEYPCNANEAFQLTGENSYIDSALVMRARKAVAEPYGPKLIGVDPARYGDDRTSIIIRQGRVCSKLLSYSKKDTMEVVGIIVQLILTESPAKVFVDVGGLGAGIVDRLKELGHGDIVVAVNAGSKPLNANLYINKRAEMWGTFKTWLEDEPCQIPDSDSLHSDICGIKYTYDSLTRLVMEKKEDMKRRGIRSPDEADALCLTFAYPESALMEKKTNPILKNMATDFNRKFNAIQQSRMGI